jgi:hypothetical protein
MDMNTAQSIRAAVEALYPVFVRASRAEFDNRRDRQVRLAFEKALKEWNAAQNTARQEFAASRGWKYNPRKWTKNYPVIDHAEHFDGPNRKTAALLSHSYADIADIEQYAIDHNYDVELLSWSWYFPGACLPVLFTPRGTAP